MRSRIVLLASEGHSVTEIARRLAVTPATVRLWCERFHRRGVGALEKDAPGRGRRPGMDKRTVVAVLRAMSTPPAGRVWTARTLAAAVGTSVSTVWRVWKRFHVAPSSSQERLMATLRQAVSATAFD
jgi:transposase